jgi:non-reducing end alpha-L-arabinofuranosidase
MGRCCKVDDLICGAVDGSPAGVDAVVSVDGQVAQDGPASRIEVRQIDTGLEASVDSSLDAEHDVPLGAGGTGGAGGVAGMGGSGTGGQGGISGLDVGAESGVGGGGATGGTQGHGGGGGTGSGGSTIDAPVATGGITSTGGTGGVGSGTGGAASGGIVGTGGAGRGGTVGTGGIVGSGGAPGTGGTTTPQRRPCDVYAAASPPTPCVAAHSTVRALFATFNGSLYQVRRASDSLTQDVGVLSPGGPADSGLQDSFCASTTCVFTKIYDQSGHGNLVEYEGTGSSVGGKGNPATATTESLNVGGHKVYSLYLKTGNAYWGNGSLLGMPTGASPQGVYMVTSGTHQGSGCCFDYGNGTLSRTVEGCGTVDAVNFSSNTMWEKGAGSGPWVMADFECGLKAGGNPNLNLPSMPAAYVTAIQKNNGTSEFALRGGDATSGTLTTYFKGKLIYTQAKQGAIVLGSGSDCCYSNTSLGQGTFYEGAIVAGYPSDATDDAVLQNIIGAGYGK